MLYGEHAKCQAEAEYPELWRGLVGAWSPCLNPRGGTKLYDWSGRANHGTLTNMDPATDWVVNSGNRGLDFDGANDYVAIDSADKSSLPGQFTIEAWIVIGAMTGTRSIVSNANSGGTVCQFSFDLNRTTRRLSVLANSATVALTSSTDLDLAKLYHVAAVKSGAPSAWKFEIFVNGCLDGSATSSVNPQATQSIAIGRLGAANLFYFAGVIFDLTLKSGVCDVLKSYSLGPGGWATTRRRRWNYATAQTAIPYWVFARKNARLIGGGVS